MKDVEHCLLFSLFSVWHCLIVASKKPHSSIQGVRKLQEQISTEDPQRSQTVKLHLAININDGDEEEPAIEENVDSRVKFLNVLSKELVPLYDKLKDVGVTFFKFGKELFSRSADILMKTKLFVADVRRIVKKMTGIREDNLTNPHAGRRNLWH